MGYRVDNLPRYLHPFVKAYGLAGAAGVAAIMQAMRSTCHWEFSSAHSNNNVLFDQPCIHCVWHEYVPPYMGYYFPLSRPHVWLQHPAAYMKPFHFFIQWNHGDYVLGSSGHGGQEALNLLTERMRGDNTNSDNNNSQKYSTAFFPDGPNGPKRVVKPGVIQVALATGLPIVPIQFQVESSWRQGWDQKHYPKPFSTVRVREMEPLYVDDQINQQDAVATLEKLLGT